MDRIFQGRPPQGPAFDLPAGIAQPHGYRFASLSASALAAERSLGVEMVPSLLLGQRVGGEELA